MVGDLKSGCYLGRRKDGNTENLQRFWFHPRLFIEHKDTLGGEYGKLYRRRNVVMHNDIRKLQAGKLKVRLVFGCKF